MLRNVSKLECKINEKFYEFVCDMDCPLEHVKEALFQFTKYIGQLEDSLKAKIEESKAQNASNVENKVNPE